MPELKPGGENAPETMDLWLEKAKQTAQAAEAAGGGAEQLLKGYESQMRLWIAQGELWRDQGYIWHDIVRHLMKDDKGG